METDTGLSETSGASELENFLAKLEKARVEIQSEFEQEKEAFVAKKEKLISRICRGTFFTKGSEDD